MKKKILAAVMAATMVFSLVACGSSDAGSNAATGSANAATGSANAATESASAGTTSSSSSGDMIKVGIINNDPNESGYRTANDKDMKNTFTEANGYEASFAYSLKNDEQITAAQKFIQDGVDYLLLSAADTAGWDSVLKDAQDAGIRVILFDRTIDADESLYEASIVSDMAKEGQTAVDWLKSQNLSEYNIIHLQGVMGSAAQQGRTGALDDAAANDGFNLVTQQTAEWNAEKAQQIVQSVIDAGTPFNVIYAENDDMAKGAVAALDKANISHGVGKDVIVMGFDCNKWALEELGQPKEAARELLLNLLQESVGDSKDITEEKTAALPAAGSYYGDSSHAHSRTDSGNLSTTGYSTSAGKKRSPGKIILLAFLVICASPVSIALLFAGLAVLAAVVLVIAAVIFSMAVTGVSAIAGGIVLTGFGMTLIARSLAAACMMVGSGFLMAGAGILVGVLTIYICKWCAMGIGRLVNRLARKKVHKNE